MERKWWKEGVVYQIYPRSFMDSNGDGIGDLRGIISKLPYLKELGVDIIWLCPVYKSPNDDNGYDISDYKDIMDEFGTMKDWEELLDEMHHLGMKLIMDLVINHTSDEHPWFLESRSSKDSAYRDYYIWRKGSKDKEPNNWLGCFGGSAWEYDNATGEYYLHLFTKRQPDLNWDNPKLRGEIYDMVRWWLDKGIDGFRLDAINCISKGPETLEELPQDSIERWGGLHFMDKPLVHHFLHEMNERVLSEYDIMTVGETPGVTPEDGILYTAEERKELSMIFQFELMDLDVGPKGKWDIVPWSLDDMKASITKWQLGLQEKGWNSLYLNNHDQPRMVSRFGNDTTYRKESAKLLATLIHTLQGTPYVYQGEEIGMTNVAFESIEQYRDIETLNYYHYGIHEKGLDPKDVMRAIHIKSRDNARTPMQWDCSRNAGFTSGTPWMDVNPNYTEINAKNEIHDPDSIFNYYKKLIGMRKALPVVVYGKFELIEQCKSPLFVYTRSLENQKLLVALNFSEDKRQLKLPEDILLESYSLILCNYANRLERNESANLMLPYEARIYLLE
ncbi:MAG: alpha-glucosidase [Clostridia bacterium]|nr:alpha-glucosidase [Clostridia bacterium]